MRRRSLSFKLLLSYLIVVTIASVAAFGVARWLGPRLFDHEVQQIGLRLGQADSGGAGTGVADGSGGGRGRGAGNQSGTTLGTDPEVEVGRGTQQIVLDEELVDAFSGSLTVAMLVALAVGGVAGLVGAVLVSRRLVRPLQGMRAAVRRMAEGRHDERVPVPADLELADLARDINALGQALEDVEERRTRLVSDLAHEMRTPITSIDGFLEGLEDGVFQPDAETLGAMRGETRRLQRLAADLGVLSRAAEDAFDLTPIEVDLGEVAQEVGRSLAATFTAAGVVFEPGDPVLLEALADRDRMAQVFTNLLRNASQHTRRGGTVSLSMAEKDRSAQIVVSDTGEGIPSESLSKVFDRFYRIDGSAASAGGAGIGLTIARAIARAHGGDIVASSDGVGTGSSFTVTIPLRD